MPVAAKRLTRFGAVEVRQRGPYRNVYGKPKQSKQAQTVQRTFGEQPTRTPTRTSKINREACYERHQPKQGTYRVFSKHGDQHWFSKRIYHWFEVAHQRKRQQWKRNLRYTDKANAQKPGKTTE